MKFLWPFLLASLSFATGCSQTHQSDARTKGTAGNGVLVGSPFVLLKSAACLGNAAVVGPKTVLVSHGTGACANSFKVEAEVLVGDSAQLNKEAGTSQFNFQNAIVMEKVISPKRKFTLLTLKFRDNVTKKPIEQSFGSIGIRPLILDLKQGSSDTYQTLRSSAAPKTPIGNFVTHSFCSRETDYKRVSSEKTFLTVNVPKGKLESFVGWVSGNVNLKEYEAWVTGLEKDSCANAIAGGAILSQDRSKLIALIAKYSTDKAAKLTEAVADFVTLESDFFKIHAAKFKQEAVISSSASAGGSQVQREASIEDTMTSDSSINTATETHAFVQTDSAPASLARCLRDEPKWASNGNSKCGEFALYDEGFSNPVALKDQVVGRKLVELLDPTNSDFKLDLTTASSPEACVKIKLDDKIGYVFRGYLTSVDSGLPSACNGF